MNNIIITLTTIPTRLDSTYNYNMKYCIESLLNQSYTGNYEIHINIPQIYKRTGEEYIIPPWLNSITDKRLKIYRTDDCGSITKLLPTLDRVDKKEDVIIIVVDDDIVYHEDLISEHIKNREIWPNYAVGYDGLRSRNIDGSRSNFYNDIRDHYFTATGTNSLVDILQHYKSISYKRSFFGKDFSKFVDTHGTWCDDTTVSAYLAKHKIARLCTFHPDDKLFSSVDEYLNNLRHTFPIIKHTEHDSLEGCNLTRADDNSSDKETYMYKCFLDDAYSNNTWVI
tara:strand:+ start:1176 stop:2021 length:846 start_codon:yes stop_codon:yes gene_type:complete